jgi:hypothetical protein
MNTLKSLFALVFFGALIVGAVSVLPALSHAPAPQFGGLQQVSVSDDGVDWDAIILLEARHSDPWHGPSDPTAQAVITSVVTEWHVATGPQNDPNLPKILCKVVNMAKGIYYSIWMANPTDPSIGSVSVYDESGNWITAYEGKARFNFERGTPRGAQSWQILPCDQLMPPGLPTN